MLTSKVEKILRIKPIEKIWNYIKQHTKQGKQQENKNRNSKNTISFEERKRRILEKEKGLERQNNTQNTRNRLSPEELYRMEYARIRRLERFNQLNQERRNINYDTQITSIEEKRRLRYPNKAQQENSTIWYSDIRDKKVIETTKKKEEKVAINTRTKQSNGTEILKYNKDFCRMQEAYHKTTSRKPNNETVIDYENRKTQKTNARKCTIIDFKQRYAVGSNECYQYLVNRKNDTKMRNKPKGIER